MLRRGDSVPHFSAIRASGDRFEYATIWQHRQLLLVSTGDAPDAEVTATATEVAQRAAELASLDTVAVVTADAIPGVPRPGIVIADRWGEIYCVADRSAWLTADEAIEWVRFVQYKCPECEGEAK